MKKPTEEEKIVLRKIRQLQVASIVLFVLFVPLTILVSKIFPQAIPEFPITYILVMGVVGIRTSIIKCPRCGKSFNMVDPFSSEAFRSFVIPMNHCQHCDLKM